MERLLLIVVGLPLTMVGLGRALCRYSMGTYSLQNLFSMKSMGVLLQYSPVLIHWMAKSSDQMSPPHKLSKAEKKMTSLIIMGNLQHIFLKLGSLGIDFEKDYM